MHNQYRPTSRPVRIAAAAAAFVTVWVLFDFVALLGDADVSPAQAARAGYDSAPAVAAAASTRSLAA